MGSADLVYPGATHTRFHHSLGAYHLMGIALQELKIKGAAISEEEILQTSLAILLHDIGHGPFSHALEKMIVPGMHHESISQQLMQTLNEEFDGQLTMAIQIFNHEYHEKPWLHALISSQLDMDRMDYLNRDSYYTGVSEGVIGYHRILHMLAVKDGQLLVEEKGIQSIEKFLISRRMMYWQVYQHKTVLAAELMIANIVKRSKELYKEGKELFLQGALKYFYDLEKNQEEKEVLSAKELQLFCQLDDMDILGHLKAWTQHEDRVLSLLCQGFLDRKIYKIQYIEEQDSSPMIDLENKHKELNINIEDLNYFIFEGITSNKLYDIESDAINFLSKSGKTKKLDEFDHSLIHKQSRLFLEKKYIARFPI